MGQQRNGGTCAANPDCSSGSCVNSTCRGTGLIGDPCTGTFDCAAGNCTNGACS